MSVVDRSATPPRRDADVRPWLPAVLQAVETSETEAGPPTRRRPADVLVVLPLLALVGLVHAAGVADAPRRTDAEGSLVAGAWAAAQGITLPASHGEVGSAVQWGPVALWDTLTGATARAPDAVAAGRGLMVVAAVVGALLLWMLARRLDLPRWAAALAVLVAGTLPVAVEVQRQVTPAGLAVPWVLGALVLASGAAAARPSPARLLAVAGCFAVAAVVEPAAALIAPALVLWGERARASASPPRRASALAAVLVVAAAVVGLVLRLRFAGPGALPTEGPLSGTTSAVGLLAPVMAVVVVLAVLGGLALRRLRPLSAGAVPLVLVAGLGTVLPTPGAAGALALLLPPAGVLVAGVVDGFVRYRPTRLLGRDVSRAGAVAAVLAGVVVAALVAPGWVGALRALTGEPLDRPSAQAVGWVGTHVPANATVLTDGAVWVDLLRQGRPVGSVVAVGSEAAGVGATTGGWLLATGAVRRAAGASPPLAAALGRGAVRASFGTGPGRVDVLQVPAAADAGAAAPAGPTPAPTPRAATPSPRPTPATTPAPATTSTPTTGATAATPSLSVTSAAAGAQLAANPAVGLTPAARADLLAGRVDLPVVVTLAAVAAEHRIRVDAFEPATGAGPSAPLSSVRLDEVDGDPAVAGAPGVVAVTRLVEAQSGAFRPDAYLAPAEGDTPAALVLLFANGPG